MPRRTVYQVPGEPAGAVAAHEADTADAHDASAVSLAEIVGLAAANVQAAIAELDSEKATTGHDHSGTYAPTSGDVVWADSGVFKAQSGTATTVYVSGNASIPALSLPDSATTVLQGSIFVPSWWLTFSIDLWWSNPNAGAGAVRFEFRDGVNFFGNGDSLALTSNLSAVTVTAGAQDAAKVTQIFPAITNVVGKLCSLYVRRNGADAADTLVGAISIIGVKLTRVT